MGGTQALHRVKEYRLLRDLWEELGLQEMSEDNISGGSNPSSDGSGDRDSDGDSHSSSHSTNDSRCQRFPYHHH